MTTKHSENITVYRTEKGTEEIFEKNLMLDGRQRQFLLLIEKTDTFNQRICQKLYKTINIQELIAYELIKISSTDVYGNEIDISNRINQTVQSTDTDTTVTAPVPSQQVNLEEDLDVINDIKASMISSLKLACGELLTAELLSQINKATTLKQLKILSARWRTMLFGSKHDRTEVNQWFEEVNTKFNHYLST